jgi:NitT/TauT family transport system substrate-binding protein
MRRITAAVLVLLLALLFLSGCARREGPGRLAIGLLPIVDSLPFYVAEEEGYFREEGLEVQLITFTSALERDTALQTGQIDGQLADLIATALLNKERERVRVVKTTYRANPQQAQFSIVAAPGSTIRSPEGLKGATIGISENSIIDYITDRLLKGAGLSPKDVRKVGIPSIPVRMQMLIQGQLDAATIPEPFTTLALQEGGHLIMDDGKDRIGLSVLEFRTDVLREKRELVRRLVRAHERAVKAINSDPQRYQPLLAEKAKLPERVKDIFPVPPFPEGDLPTREDVAQTTAWMVERGLLSRALSYERLVDTSFVRR